MTASIRGFVTRDQAGLRDPRSISRNITPEKGGVGIHYGGGPQSAAEEASDHNLCIQTWRSWQNYHMSKGWADIAYTGGFCNHGFAFAGRGKGIRTAANGTNTGNQNYYGVVWIGGKGQALTQLAYDAADWWVQTLRESGAGDKVFPHSYFKSTECPGSDLRRYAKERHNNPITGSVGGGDSNGGGDTSGSSVNVESVQRSLEVNDDGMWGPRTDSRAQTMRTAARAKCGWPRNINRHFPIRVVQRVIDTKVDGYWGPLSQAAMVKWVKGFQKVIGTSSDGQWGPKTERAYQLARRKHLNNY